MGMFATASASISYICSLTTSIFHGLVAAWIRSDTNIGGSLDRGHSGVILKCLGIQFYVQILVSLPVPILRIQPCFITSRPSHIPPQICDGRFPNYALRKSSSGKYISHPCAQTFWFLQHSPRLSFNEALFTLGSHSGTSFAVYSKDL